MSSYSTPQLQTKVIPPITSIEAITVSLPFVTPFSISSYTWTCKEALLIKISSGEVSGWGECVADPDPFYSPETTVSCMHIIKEFILPVLRPGMSFAEFETEMRHIRGNMMAKAAVENALLDLIAKIEGVPLYKMFGFEPKRIMSGISIGIKDSIPDLLAAVQEAVDLRYHRVKMKIKKGKDIGWVAAVRESFPSLQLMVDANGDYSLDDTAHLSKLDRFGLTMIEQPLSYSDIYFHSKLQRELETPLCLDESIHSLEDAITAVELGSCRIINIKEGRVGGMAEAVRIANYCQENGIPVWSGGMDETGIGRAFNIHLQTAPAFTLPGDTSETKRYFKEDIVSPVVTLDDEGYIAIPEGPGIGVTVEEEMVRKYEIGRLKI
ncbi:MAG: o-succinylbenzoate synthase [Ignavibacteria bacterium]|nr:o-succinylbenzoate synthase [Ignavibacteria bacterium]